jgi:hypothetical protein
MLTPLSRDDTKILMPEVVCTVETSKRGRPRKIINLDFLHTISTPDRNIRITELAKIIGVHRNTLALYMKRHGVQRQFSTISNQDLDRLVKTFKSRCPESGLQYLVAFLRNHGLRVQ